MTGPSEGCRPDGLVLAVPGDPAQRTGGYLYARRMVEALQEAGRAARILSLPEPSPAPSPAACTEAERRLAEVPARELVVVDGLALGTMPEVARRVAALRPLVALVHHPLGLETGLDDATAQRLIASERRALRPARRTVVTSPATATLLAGIFGVPIDRIAAVLPGTDPAAPATRRAAEGPLRLLTVASLTPRKGHLVLARALARLRDLAWSWTVVGSPDRHPACAAALVAEIARLGLGDRVRLAGELSGEALGAAYAAADLFVLPSFLEGYGMVLAEALARALPIVATTGGAIPATVPPDAAVLVPPGDPDSLAAALRGLMAEPGRLDTLARGAAAARTRLPGWPEQARLFWDATVGAVGGIG